MQEEKKFFITTAEVEKLKKEEQDLQALKFAKIKGETPKILQSEDLNPEYLSFQEDLSLLEARLADLDYILKNYELITVPPKEKQKVINLGATVLVEVGGQTDEFEILGSLEANPATGRISSESPVGKALLGHKVGDKIIVSSPVKTIYKVKAIRYFS